MGKNELKATVLVDNTKDAGLRGEWGLSVWIEFRGKKILLDTGASELFSENASKLGLPLQEIDAAVLSHAHFDHGNGIPRFFQENGHARVYLQPSCNEGCYKKILFIRKYIGLPRIVFRQFSERLEIVTADTEILPGVHLVKHHKEGREALGARESMYRKTAGGWIIDDFSHEQSLVFETENGLIIFNSCSHGGAADIVTEVSEAFPGKPVAGLIGGFHLHNKTEAEVRAFSEKLVACGVPYVCTGHCTGEKAYEILKTYLGDRLHHLKTGLVISL